MRKTSQRHILLLALISVCSLANAQGLTEQFRDFDSWQFVSNGFRLPDDKKAGPLFEASRPPSRFSNFAGFTIQNDIFLPDDSIAVSLDFHSRNLEFLSLKMYLYGNNEQFLDSLIFHLNTNGQNLIEFNNANAKWMEIVLEGKSSNASDTVSFRILDAGIQAKNRNIDEWFKSLNFDIDLASLFPLKKITELDELKNKKIIGLGESVHGSRTIKQEKIEIVQKLLNENVKLICFEESVDVCLNWDLYIQGIHPYSYRYTILDELRNDFSDAADYVKFLDHLREVNSTRKKNDRIHIVGLDLRQGKDNFFHYFIAYKKLSKDKEFLSQLILKIDSLQYDNLFYTKWGNLSRIGINMQMDSLVLKFSRLADYLKYEKKLQSMMQENDYRFLIDVLLMEVPTFDDANEVKTIDRDSIMWNIFQKALLRYAPAKNDRAVIMSHSLHLSRERRKRYGSVSGLMEIKSLGSYIAETYPDDYWVISFTVGGGDIKSFDPIINFFRDNNLTGIEKLQEPPFGSFERAAKNIVLNRFYCNSSDLNGDLYTYRFLGNRAGKAQFYYFPRNRFDGYVYLNESTASQAIGFTNLHPYADIVNMIDSMKLHYTPYSKSFGYDIDSLDVTVPKDFTYKNVKRLTRLCGAIVAVGLFESKDKNCLIIVDQSLLYYDRNNQVSQEFLRLPKPDFKEVVRLELWGALKMSLRPSEIERPLNGGTKSNSDLQYQAFYDKVVEFKSSEYAKKTFNADNAAEFYHDIGIYFSGRYYTHKQVVIMGKNRNVLRIYCYYTDEGFANREKYRNAVESVLRFK